MSPGSLATGQSWGASANTPQLASPLRSPQGPLPAQESTTTHQDPASSSCLSPSTPERSEDKPSHDASVFVGSLPCNIDQNELTRLLTIHLSAYAEVKSIKVVRDSKGGICAFVQCESAEAASTLIRTLHTEKPKPFMGRILRFEPARAFRTLLISYRSPTYNVHDSQHGRLDSNAVELPTAMRIWKIKGARFHNIAYNDDALKAEAHAKQNTPVAEEAAILLRPLKFDFETIRIVASYFGRVEKVTVFQPDPTRDELPCDDLWQAYPPPHHAPRSPSMDTGCWEVKWDFRDDCVSALMALRRVPHLTVTWAHQPSYSGWECRHAIPAHFPQALPPTYMPNQSFPSTSSLNSASPLFMNSASTSITNFHPALSQDGNDNASQAAKSVTAHSSHLAVDQPSTGGHASGWTIWRPSPATDPSFTPLSPYTASPFYPSIVRNDAVPSTPKTPSSVYPLTPKSCSEEEKSFTHGPISPGMMQGSGTVDPTSLFVGGLEVLGPAGWDEDKVRQYFSKFGGLQHVKFVKPFNAVTGFAFLKFDNIAGPARAVQEEHNRVWGNHVLRVRLRDCNPPRTSWKHGRGRGRLFHHNGPAYRKFHNIEHNGIRPDIHDHASMHRDPPLSAAPDDHERSPSRESHTSPSTDGQTLHDDSPSPPPSESEKSQGGASSDEQKPSDTPQRYREWYDDLEVPSPTSLPVSSSMPIFTPPYPYVIPNVPFYGQPPWAQPYMHPQPPYLSVPYFNPYPMYPPVMHPSQPISIVADQASGTQAAWAPQGVVYSSPYYGFPGPMRHPSEAPKAPVALATLETSEASQPPNTPLGPPPASSSIKVGLPSDPGHNPRPHQGCAVPNQPQSSTPSRPFLQPPPGSWNSAPPVTPPGQLMQANGAQMPPPHWNQHPPHVHYVPEASTQAPRESNRKRQNFRRENQAGFNGGRGMHRGGQNTNRMQTGHGGHFHPNQAIPPGGARQSPPVWI